MKVPRVTTAREKKSRKKREAERNRDRRMETAGLGEDKGSEDQKKGRGHGIQQMDRESRESKREVQN